MALSRRALSGPRGCEASIVPFAPVPDIVQVSSGSIMALLKEADARKRNLAHKAELARNSRKRRKEQLAQLETEVAQLRTKLRKYETNDLTDEERAELDAKVAAHTTRLQPAPEHIPTLEPLTCSPPRFFPEEPTSPGSSSECATPCSPLSDHEVNSVDDLHPMPSFFFPSIIVKNAFN